MSPQQKILCQKPFQSVSRPLQLLRPRQQHREHLRRNNAASSDDKQHASHQESLNICQPSQLKHPSLQQQQQQQSQQQQPPQQQYPPGYDPDAAAGFMPLPGDKPFWWVEKFEERRRKLAEEQAELNSNSSSSQLDYNSNNSSTSSSRPSPALLGKVAVQLLQLAVVNAALILWPASLYPGGLAVQQVWLCYLCYMLFFAGGSVYRLVQYGPLAARKKDQQGKTWWHTLAWILFVVSMPIIHWSPVVWFCKQQQQQMVAGMTAGTGGSAHGYVTLYDVIGFAMLAGAVALNWWSARHLGRAYDRVVQPESLVTSGPYAYVQHPIYSSYMLLFVGYCMMMHSLGMGVFALAVCLLYYASRTKLEAAVLQKAFGQPYEEYQASTKLFIPYVV